MPMLIHHIDAIAREKKRDVLFLHFENYIEDKDLEDNARNTVLAWLDEHGIAYTPCMGIEDESIIDGYLGDVYLELPFDEQDPQYQLVQQYLEDDEGNMKIEDVFFFVLSFEVALEIEADRKEQNDLEDEFEDDAEDPMTQGRLS
jgi:hypothetical protein